MSTQENFEGNENSTGKVRELYYSCKFLLTEYMELLKAIVVCHGCTDSADVGQTFALEKPYLLSPDAQYREGQDFDTRPSKQFLVTVFRYDNFGNIKQTFFNKPYILQPILTAEAPPLTIHDIPKYTVYVAYKPKNTIPGDIYKISDIPLHSFMTSEEIAESYPLPHGYNIAPEEIIPKPFYFEWESIFTQILTFRIGEVESHFGQKIPVPSCTPESLTFPNGESITFHLLAPPPFATSLSFLDNYRRMFGLVLEALRTAKQPARTSISEIIAAYIRSGVGIYPPLQKRRTKYSKEEDAETAAEWAQASTAGVSLRKFAKDKKMNVPQVKKCLDRVRKWK